MLFSPALCKTAHTTIAKQITTHKLPSRDPASEPRPSFRAATQLPSRDQRERLNFPPRDSRFPLPIAARYACRAPFPDHDIAPPLPRR